MEQSLDSMKPDALSDTTALLRDLPFAACYTNSRNEFVAVNDAFCRIYRLRPHDLIGKTPWVLATSDFSDDLAKEISGAVDTAGWWSGSIVNLRSDRKKLALHLFALRLGWLKKYGEGSELRLGIAVDPKHRDSLLRFSMDLNARVLATKGSAGGNLTGRENEVRGLMSAGMKSKEIAGVLGISDSTVRVHLAAIRRRRTAIG